MATLTIKEEVEDLKIRLLNSLGYYDEDVEVLSFAEIKERYWQDTFKRGIGHNPYEEE